MVLGSEIEHVELSVAEVQPPVPGSYPGGDVRVVVRVQVRGFSGATDAWVLRESWSDFVGQLSRLEGDRKGEAILAGVSPGELRLRFFAIDHAGHMAVDGELCAYLGVDSRLEVDSLKFARIEFDPTALPAFVRELETAGRAV